jgi:hypothetical protein
LAPDLIGPGLIGPGLIGFVIGFVSPGLAFSGRESDLSRHSDPSQ